MEPTILAWPNFFFPTCQAKFVHQFSSVKRHVVQSETKTLQKLSLWAFGPRHLEYLGAQRITGKVPTIDDTFKGGLTISW